MQAIQTPHNFAFDEVGISPRLVYFSLGGLMSDPQKIFRIYINVINQCHFIPAGVKSVFIFNRN